MAELKSDANAATARAWSPRTKALASVLIAWHVAAVFVGPWSMPGVASQLGTACGRLFRPYTQALALDNGYRFFAPEPGPSHLIRYEIDGGRVRGEFPNRAEHWPRLWYHRHFMLTEFVNSLESAARDERSPARTLSEAYAASYAQHLASVHQGREVKLWLVRHRLPTPADVLAGKRLTDPEFYDEVELGRFSEDAP